jgi:hypothetical protein
MSEKTRVVCDGCGKELEHLRAPFTVEVSVQERPGALVVSGVKQHACSLPCWRGVLAALLAQWPAQADGAVRKGAYR